MYQHFYFEIVDLVTQKVQEYGALLKLGKFQLSFKALQQLWLVFLCLAPESMYCRGVLLYLLQLEHWKTYWRNPFTMLKNHFSSFIEEDGELSFSVLSRTVLQDSHKSSFDTLNNAFKAQRLHLQAAASLLEELDCVDFSRSTHTFFNHGDIEVQLLKEFLLQHINQLRDNIFDPYPPLAKAAFYKPRLDLLKEMAQTSQTAHMVGTNFEWCSPALVRFPPREAPFQNGPLLDQSHSVLASLHRLFLEDNLNGLDIRYILQPEPVVATPMVFDDLNYSMSRNTATEHVEKELMSLTDWLNK